MRHADRDALLRGVAVLIFGGDPDCVDAPGAVAQSLCPQANMVWVHNHGIRRIDRPEPRGLNFATKAAGNLP